MRPRPAPACRASSRAAARPHRLGAKPQRARATPPMRGALSSRVPRTYSSTADRLPSSATGPIAAASPLVAQATSLSTASQPRAPAISPRGARANSQGLEDPGGIEMSLVSDRRRGRLIAVALWALSLLGAAEAQQDSKELTDLRSTASDLYRSGEFLEALR